MIEQNINAADVLLCSGYYKQAVILWGIAVRTSVFRYLEYHQVPYNSSREAFLKVLTSLNQESIISDLWKLETISTLCEWDPDFQLSESTALEIKGISLHCIKELYHGV